MPWNNRHVSESLWFRTEGDRSGFYKKAIGESPLLDCFFYRINIKVLTAMNTFKRTNEWQPA